MSMRQSMSTRGAPVHVAVTSKSAATATAAASSSPAPAPVAALASAIFHPSRASAASSVSRKLIGDYVLGKTLGAGSMGKVKLATHQRTGLKVACKIIPRASIPGDPDADPRTIPDADNKEVRVVREAAILQLLRHPNVVRLYDMVVERKCFYLFFEYVSGGQMLDYIISHGKLKERVARKFTRQMISAVDYCHRNSVIHRDLKIENVLLTDTGRVKLIDFGLANLYSPRSQLKTFCGSLYFAAPELLNAKPYVGPEIDVWSLGVILYVLVCGKVPFDDQSMPVLHAKIKRGVVEYPSHLSQECRHLLGRMLVVDPKLRATMSEVRRHPFINKGHTHMPITHLPARAPLKLPLDPSVLRRMNGFQFGTERAVREHLEGVVAAWMERRKLARMMSASGFAGDAPRTELSSSAKASAVDGSKLLAPPESTVMTAASALQPESEEEGDLEDAVENGGLERDPMVSIYYLVHEKAQREARGEEQAAEEYWEREKALERDRENKKRARDAAKLAGTARVLNRSRSTGNDMLGLSGESSGNCPDQIGFFKKGIPGISRPNPRRATTTGARSPVSHIFATVQDPEFAAREAAEEARRADAGGTISRFRRVVTERERRMTIEPENALGISSDPSTTMSARRDGPGVFRRLSNVIRAGSGDSVRIRKVGTPNGGSVLGGNTGFVGTQPQELGDRPWSDENTADNVGPAALNVVDNIARRRPSSHPGGALNVNPSDALPTTGDPVPAPGMSRSISLKVLKRRSGAKKVPENTEHFVDEPASMVASLPSDAGERIPIPRIHDEDLERPQSRHGLQTSVDSVDINTAVKRPQTSGGHFRHHSDSKDGLARRVSALWNRAANRGGSIRDDRRNTITDLAELDERPSSAEKNDEQPRRSLHRLQPHEAGQHLRMTIPTASDTVQPLRRGGLNLTIEESEMEGSDDGGGVKTVYLKGLFSVVTTSTRPVQDVRDRLMRAFDESRLVWCELPRQRFELRYQYVFGADSETPVPREDEERWRREVLMEASIVKIPWLFKVFGVRFHRVSGDPWRYKECCDTILTRAKL